MIYCGIDRIGQFDHLFRGKRLGMVTAASAVDRKCCPSYVSFHARYPLSCLFTPEHGLLGTFGNGEDVTEAALEPNTGIPVVSLYGGRKAKSIPNHWLENLDGIVYDIQDLGTRFYTFIATMIRVMEDCAGVGLDFIVLDRPVLLGGDIVEGCMLRPRFQSIIGPHPLPVRYGLTAGELAKLVNAERNLNCRLHVVPCEGWKRSIMDPDFGREWARPSGAIRNFETALFYPGMCLFEGTNLSEGRGTDLPFRQIGAPFVDGVQLCREMNALGLPGLVFESVQFCPRSSKFKDQLCGGVRLQITDRHAFRSVYTGLHLLCKIMELWPEQISFPDSPYGPGLHIHYLSGCESLGGNSQRPEEIRKQWESESEVFQNYKKQFHLYP